MYIICSHNQSSNTILSPRYRWALVAGGNTKAVANFAATPTDIIAQDVTRYYLHWIVRVAVEHRQAGRQARYTHISIRMRGDRNRKCSSLLFHAHYKTNLILPNHIILYIKFKLLHTIDSFASFHLAGLAGAPHRTAAEHIMALAQHTLHM